MVMEDEKKTKSENGDVWKNIIEEVKEESPKAVGRSYCRAK